MKVKELLEILKTMPEDAEVMFNYTDGCNECNPYGYDDQKDINGVEFYKEFKYAIFDDVKPTVMLY